jgi:hypothetical protein
MTVLRGIAVEPKLTARSSTASNAPARRSRTSRGERPPERWRERGRDVEIGYSERFISAKQSTFCGRTVALSAFLRPKTKTWVLLLIGEKER